MKKVFNSSYDVIHLWAQRTQDEARCGNVFFDNKDTIYSYGKHYLLAEFLNPEAVLINDDGYSVTTSKHIREVSSATSHFKQFYKSDADSERVRDALEYYARKLETARKPELYTEPARRTWKRHNAFLEYMQRKTATKKTRLYKEARAIIKAIESDPKNSSETVKKNARLRKQREAREVKARNVKEVKEFRNYKRHSVHQRNGRDVLRVKKDGSGLFTSQQITIQWSEAKRLLRLLDLGKLLGAKVNEAYTITAANGVIKAGCHSIERDEVERFRELIEAH